MSTEMEFQQGLNVQILRKLVYLYTRGMQYYDLIHKDKFKQFYSDKLVSLLKRKNVEQFLDKNPINFEEKDDLDLLFPSKKKQTDSKIQDEDFEKEEEENNIKNEVDYEMKDFSNKIRKNSIYLVKNKIKDYDIRLFVKKKLLQVNSNLNKIDQALSNEMIEQMSEFEENKRKRKVKKSQNSIIINRNDNEIKEKEIVNNEEIKKEKENNKETQEDKNSDTNSISTPSSNDEEPISSNQNIIKSTGDELKILELSELSMDQPNKIIEEKNEKPNSNTNTPTKNLIGNNPMLREIEDYVQKNMNEMYQALEELKASFQDEITEAEESGFEDIANGLKEDLQVELDNLKDQYEEQRRAETEKIKAKYAKRNVLL